MSEVYQNVVASNSACVHDNRLYIEYCENHSSVSRDNCHQKVSKEIKIFLLVVAFLGGFTAYMPEKSN